ncbi:hypothetical protein BDZ91DRAFT_800223 [Kalaharituber pfeilii]|nr:hypothetical protein BDZ91DRAFT_800223 [Kalaharituber pfeilii]
MPTLNKTSTTDTRTYRKRIKIDYRLLNEGPGVRQYQPRAAKSDVDKKTQNSKASRNTHEPIADNSKQNESPLITSSVPVVTRVSCSGSESLSSTSPEASETETIYIYRGGGILRKGGMFGPYDPTQTPIYLQLTSSDAEDLSESSKEKNRKGPVTRSGRGVKRRQTEPDLEEHEASEPKRARLSSTRGKIEKAPVMPALVSDITPIKTKRGRGRPRKITRTCEQQQSIKTDAPIKRPRGRPRKIANASAQTQSTISITPRHSMDIASILNSSDSTANQVSESRGTLEHDTCEPKDDNCGKNAHIDNNNSGASFSEEFNAQRAEMQLQIEAKPDKYVPTWPMTMNQALRLFHEITERIDWYDQSIYANAGIINMNGIRIVAARRWFKKEIKRLLGEALSQES